MVTPHPLPEPICATVPRVSERGAPTGLLWQATDGRRCCQAPPEQIDTNINATSNNTLGIRKRTNPAGSHWKLDLPPQGQLVYPRTPYPTDEFSRCVANYVSTAVFYVHQTACVRIYRLRTCLVGSEMKDIVGKRRISQ